MPRAGRPAAAGAVSAPAEPGPGCLSIPRLRGAAAGGGSGHAPRKGSLAVLLGPSCLVGALGRACLSNIYKYHENNSFITD